MINDKAELEKDRDKGLPVIVSMFVVAVSALFIQVLALRSWTDLDNSWSVRLLSGVCGARQQSQVGTWEILIRYKEK